MAGACQYFSGRSRSVERQEEEAKAASDECIPTNQPYSNCRYICRLIPSWVLPSSSFVFVSFISFLTMDQSAWHCFYWPLL